MKRMFTLLLTLAMVIATVTGCGCTASPDSTTENATGNAGTSTGNEESSNETPNNSENGFQDNGITSPYDDNITGDTGDVGNGIDTAPDNGHSILDDAGNAIENGVNDVENALNGNASTAKNRAGGISYDKMLKNAHVHDRDGNLKDRENSVSTRLS